MSKYFYTFMLKIRAVRGSVLLESLVAITILTVCLLGVFALLSRSLGLTRVIADRYVGANLAAEGIELIKNIIDTNGIQEKPWNSGLGTGEYEMAYNTALEQNNHRALSYDSGTALYDYQGGNVVTPFHRAIQLQRIGEDELKVNSIVSWSTRGGAEFEVNLEDHFFNWRKKNE